MEVAYKFRIYPNKFQEEQIQKTFGCCRYVYNHYLALRKAKYEADKSNMNYYECAKDLTILKKVNEWLKEVDSQALQQSLRNLEAGFQHFFVELKIKRILVILNSKAKRIDTSLIELLKLKYWITKFNFSNLVW